MRTTQQTNKTQIARRFDQAANHYDAHAILQNTIGEQLCKQVLANVSAASAILDLGSGPGRLSHTLMQRFPQTQLCALDIAPKMLTQALLTQTTYPLHRICADFDALPLCATNFDVIVSNMAMQWSRDIKQVLQQLHHLLTNGGVCAFSLPVVGTFTCLLACLQEMGSEGYAFHDPKTLTDTLRSQHWKIQSFHCEKKTLFYPTLADFVRALQLVGANYFPKRHNNLGRSKQHWEQLVNSYEKFRCSDGLPVDYHIGFWVLKK